MNEQAKSPVIFAYAVLLSIASLILIFMGGLVTSTGSGLSVPDWPLSFGQVFPPMKGGVIFEHSHRLVATVIGMMTIGLVLIVTFKSDNPLLKKLGWAALGIVILQGVLGGVTVLLGLSVAASVAHACLGQLFFALVVSIAAFTTTSWQSSPPIRKEPKRNLMLLSLSSLLWASIFIQLVFGAILRHSGKGLHWHITGAVVVAFLVTWVRKRVKEGRITDPAGTSWGAMTLSLFFLALVHIQLLLGIITYLLVYTRVKYQLPTFVSVPIVTIHVMVGALLMAMAVLMTIWSYRTRPN